jgi:hypothetical protein
MTQGYMGVDVIEALEAEPLNGKPKANSPCNGAGLEAAS